MDGMDSIGMNTPEMKIRGSLTRFSMDMISPGLSVGYAANRVPMVAKQNEVRMMPAIRGATLTIGVPKMSSPAISGNERDTHAVQESAQALPEHYRMQGDRGRNQAGQMSSSAVRWGLIPVQSRMRRRVS